MEQVVVKDMILKNYRDQIAYKLDTIPYSKIREFKADLIADSSKVQRTLYGDLSLQIGDRQSVFDR